MIDLSKNQRSINTSGAHVDGGDVEALGAHFERGHPDHGLTHCRVNPAEYDDPFASTAWRAYQAGHAAAKAEAADPVVGRWYFVTNDGAATLCVDEADARESATEADIAFPRMAPHRAVQLVPADQLAAAVAAEREWCAQLCEAIEDRYREKEWLKCAELKTDAETGAGDCANAIRSGK